MSIRHGPLRVALPCSGLGRQHRGFETFAREVASALHGDPRVEITLFGGGGHVAPGERSVWNIPRASTAARAMGAMFARSPYFVEQATFFAAFAPRLTALRPDLVYFADLNLGNACWHWRRATRQRYRMLFYNGGATTMPYTRCDLVQQVSPEHFDAAVQRNESPERMVLLPHGIEMPAMLGPRDEAARATTRHELDVAPDRAMLLAVGMLDATVKRMDVLIDAVAALGVDRPHLVMLGEQTPETPALLARARAQLGSGVTVTTWPRARMAAAYAAADAFALLSLREGFGLAYLEALAAGLPCVAHDTPTTRHILDGHGFLGDTTNSRVTVHLLQDALRGAGDIAAQVVRHAAARARFSWDVLAPQYVDMLLACAAGTRPNQGGS
ncbi:MAG: glycosyltransferase family 4 protein [Gemmatimonadetes bacterium]|nr:glycosyltransferase family 4 protein [Gemmatimonadota bacterium]